METETHWGIIGTGRIAHKFAQDLRLVPHAKLHAVAASDRSRAQDFARQYGAEYAFGSYEAIVNCPHLDVVYIASTHEKHYPNALMCLKRRIPVLCEKPLAINLKEVTSLIETAQQHKTFFMEAMWSRFIPCFQKIIDTVEKGVIGRPLSIKADFGFFQPFEENSRLYNKITGGGSLLDIGIYPLTLALSILGKPFKINVLAHLNPITKVDETCAMQLGYESGAIAILNSSVTCHLGQEAWIFGEKGYIHVPIKFHHPHFFEIYHYDGKNEPRREIVRMPYEGHGLHFEAAEVQHCLRHNLLESPMMPHAFSATLMEIMDNVREKVNVVYENHD